MEVIDEQAPLGYKLLKSLSKEELMALVKNSNVNPDIIEAMKGISGFVLASALKQEDHTDLMELLVGVKKLHIDAFIHDLMENKSNEEFIIENSKLLADSPSPLVHFNTHTQGSPEIRDFETS